MFGYFLFYLLGLISFPVFTYFTCEFIYYLDRNSPERRSFDSTKKIHSHEWVEQWIEELLTQDQISLLKKHAVSINPCGSGGLRIYRSTPADCYRDVLGVIETITIDLSDPDKRGWNDPILYEYDFDATGENVKKWVEGWIESGCELPDMKKR